MTPSFPPRGLYLATHGSYEAWPRCLMRCLIAAWQGSQRDSSRACARERALKPIFRLLSTHETRPARHNHES